MESRIARLGALALSLSFAALAWLAAPAGVAALLASAVALGGGILLLRAALSTDPEPLPVPVAAPRGRRRPG